MSLVNAHCQFDPLEEVWVGDCYPAEFYKDYDPKIRSAFERITDLTKTDLARLSEILESLGVTVRRPKFSNNPDDYRNDVGSLIKPPVAPRDHALVLGNTLYHLKRSMYRLDPWQEALDDYRDSGANVIVAQFLEKYGYLEPPSIVRIGQDLYIEKDSHIHSWSLIERDVIPEWSKEYTVHVCHTSGHADAVFCAVGPGRILTSHWKSDYSDEFPGWDVFHLPKQNSNVKQSLQKLNSFKERCWWVDDHGNPATHAALNQYIKNYAADWVGLASETVFEVNSLMVNESLILTTGTPDISTVEWFKKHKIEWIPIEMRTRGFWDAGIHCLTVDIRRTGNNRKIIV
jgi:hypothetical protein